MEKEQEQVQRQWEPRVSSSELSPVDKLTPGFYTCPVKGAAKRVYGDYRKIGDPKGLPFKSD